MFKKITALIIAVFMLIPVLCGCGTDASPENEVGALTLGKDVFGDLTITGYVYTYGTQASRTDEIETAVYSFLDDFNAKISTKEPSSFLYKFNHKTGGAAEMDSEGVPTGWTRYEIDRHAYTMLSRAETLQQETEGYFDPTVYPLMKLWGLRTGEYDNPELHRRTLPRPSDVSAIRSTFCGLDKIRLSASSGKYYVSKDESRDRVSENSDEPYTTMLDLGAQAKGYAADRVKEILSGYQNVTGASFSLSGNTYLYGKYPETKKIGDKYYKTGESDFISGVVDPDPMNVFGKPIVGFSVDAATGMSAVTSGDYVRRYYLLDGKFYDGKNAETPEEVTYFCHIVDPKTGYPCNLLPDYNAASKNKYKNKTADALTSVTILSDSSERADVYATAVMLMGMDQGIEWLNARGVEAFLIGTDRRYANVLDGRKIDTDSKTYTLKKAGYTPVTGYAV